MPKLTLVHLLVFLLLSTYSCNSNSQDLAEPHPVPRPAVQQEAWSPIDTSGKILKDRFVPPPGFKRKTYASGSFENYLQQLPMKSDGSWVKYYNGGQKPPGRVYIGVIDMDIGTRDLQQCADAIMRLRGEYLYMANRYDDIRFDLTNGFDMTFAKWRQGYRIKVTGNKISWVKSKSPSSTYTQFRSYMNMVFAYAGTLSLAKELESVSIQDLQVGDVFIQGGSPGHAVIVVDLAVNEEGEKRFLLAQSYMPAQDIQILQNPTESTKNPWFSIPDQAIFETPEWNFDLDNLKRF
ncbi:MAG: DUF4846 domain-containing protein [Saprospiraceae bacterium]|nr:DUF4846 domain-containing protein [Saprospiraceae bacterium]